MGLLDGKVAILTGGASGQGAAEDIQNEYLAGRRREAIALVSHRRQGIDRAPHGNCVHLSRRQRNESDATPRRVAIEDTE